MSSIIRLTQVYSIVEQLPSIVLSFAAKALRQLFYTAKALPELRFILYASFLQFQNCKFGNLCR